MCMFTVFTITMVGQDAGTTSTKGYTFIGRTSVSGRLRSLLCMWN